MTEEPQRRRPGRPRRFGTGRIHTAVRFSPERHRELKEAAEGRRRSVSEEVEARIEELASYKEALVTAARITDIARQSLEAALREADWSSLIDPRYGGRVWIPAGQFPLPKSGFIEAKEAVETPRAVVTVTPAVEETLSRIVEGAVAKALARAKLTIGEDQ